MSGFRLNRRQLIGGSSLAQLMILELTALILVACGGGAALDQPAPPADDSAPPAVSPQQPDLALPPDGARQVSANHHMRLRRGADFDPLLPHDRMAAEDTFAVFWPDWDPAARPPSFEPAYAVYNFYLDDLEGRPLVILCWETPPASWDDFAIGVANWEEGRWEWHRGPADDLLQLEALDPYVSEEGVLLVMVMLTGTEECVLKWIQGPRRGVTDATVTGSQGDYAVSLQYYVSDIAPPMVVDVQVGFSPADGTTPFHAFGESGYTYYAVVTPHTSGHYTHFVPLGDLPPGGHLIAIRVTDSNGGSDVMWFPWKVWFFPR